VFRAVETDYMDRPGESYKADRQQKRLDSRTCSDRSKYF